MRNAEYRAAQRQREVACLSCWSIPPAHIIIGPVCIVQSPLSANNIPHSALRIPHSLIVRSTADHPCTPGVEAARWRSVLGTNAECGMRNAEYRAAQRQREVACLSCWSIPPAHIVDRSCLHRPVASICKQHSAFRTPHSAFPNRSIHGRPSVYFGRGSREVEVCSGNECGMRNAECRAECGVRNAEW